VGLKRAEEVIRKRRERLVKLRHLTLVVALIVGASMVAGCASSQTTSLPDQAPQSASPNIARGFHPYINSLYGFVLHYPIGWLPKT
jgi:hypothetical protein